MLDVNDIATGDLLGSMYLGPDNVLVTAGSADEIVQPWRFLGYSDPDIYAALAGWSNGYVEIVPGMPDPGEEAPPAAEPGADLGKVDEGAVGRYKARNLIRWFNHGADGQIAWGTPGDFEECSRLAIEHGKMTPEQAHGFCNLRHRDATGAAPGHAAGEKALHKADGAVPVTNPHAGPDYDPSALGLDATQLMMVDPQVPNVDRQNYQRDLNLDRVAMYEQAPKKDLEDRVGLLARRPDGSLWTIDGQHHTLAAIGRGIKKLPYRIFDSTGPKQEAQVFEAWNKRERRS